MPCILEEPADADPEDGGDADVDNCGDEQDDGYSEEDEFCGHAAVFLVSGFLVFRCHERIYFLPHGSTVCSRGRFVEVEIMLNLCGVEQRTVLFERVIVGSLLSLLLHCVLT